MDPITNSGIHMGMMEDEGKDSQQIDLNELNEFLGI